MQKTKKQLGFGLVEILVAIAIIGIVSVAVISLLGLSSRYSSDFNLEAKANYIAQEGMEAVRSARDNAWANISTNGTYIVNKTPDSWNLAASAVPENINEFTRIITIETGMRDLNDNIVESGGAPDANTKKITTIVAWNSGAKSISFVSYLTNWRD